MANVAMFIALIHRIGLLKISRILIFTGDQGRKAIRTLYQTTRSAPGAEPAGRLRGLPKPQVLLHRGPPRTLQGIDSRGLVELAKAADAVIEIEAAIGDTLMDGMPVLRVLGAPQAIEERRLRDRITLGAQRIFQQDPKYAIRILVDIAIRALSPAINDPTT